MPRLRPADDRDAGFSLVEVVVALLLLSLIAASSAAFFLRSSNASSEQQRNQAASALATKAMEDARSVRAAYLLQGRAQAAVRNQWDAASHPQEADTFQAWDATAGANATPMLPLSSTTTVSGQTYSTSTLVGICFRLRSAAADSCTRAGLSNANSTPSGYVKMYRVMVEVTWATGNKSRCSTGTCAVRSASLVDPTAELRWSVTPAPVTEPSTQGTTAQTGTSSPVSLDTLVNAGNTDQNSRLVVSSVNDGGGVFAIDGSAYSNPTRTTGRALTFTPPLNTVGTYSVRWFVRNADGQASKTVAITIPVQPVANADSVTISKALLGSTTIDPLANDKPNSGTSVVVTTPARTGGSCTLTRIGSSNQFKVSNSGLLETCTFTYTVQGAGSNSALQTAPTTLTIRVIA